MAQYFISTKNVNLFVCFVKSNTACILSPSRICVNLSTGVGYGICGMLGQARIDTCVVIFIAHLT